ncbi:MAG: hypothetical protein HC930_12930 [Hydrococcus sp. SU_1_0]|nr:hypothetical protein [Hydrococcus sp. SU_1_0]
MSKKIIAGGRRSFLFGLGVLGGFGAANLLCQRKNTSTSAEEVNQSLENKQNKVNTGNAAESLRKIAAAKGILYGGYHQRSPGDFTQDLKFQRAFLDDYGLIVGAFWRYRRPIWG